jgi:hypothetical protein
VQQFQPFHQIPNFPDLVACNFWLFLKLKIGFREHNFMSSRNTTDRDSGSYSHTKIGLPEVLLAVAGPLVYVEGQYFKHDCVMF